MRRLKHVVPFAASALLLACAGPMMKLQSLPAMQPGTPEADVVRAAGGPESTVTQTDGSRHLIYTTQPGGTQCFLARFDPQGRLIGVEDTLSEAGRAKIERGMTRQALLERLCKPIERMTTAHPYEVLSWNVEALDASQPRRFDVYLQGGQVHHTEVRTLVFQNSLGG